MEFQVNTNNVILAQINQVESGEYNVTECKFIFSSEYEGLTKIAVFTGANGDAYKITILNNKCEIPSELLTESQIVQIGVYAYEIQDTEFVLRYSPMPTRFMIEKGSYVVNAVNMSRLTPTEVEQLQSQITHNANDIDVLEGNILNLQEEQVEQNRNIQANADDIEEIKAEQITQNTNIQKNTDDIVNINQAIDTINTDITDIDSAIGDINEDIDNLEQDLTNYSLITETGSQIILNVNSTNYQITAILKDKNGNVIYTSNAIDLPIESMIVNASYDNTTKEIVLTLQNGQTLRFSVADLVSGLVSETQLQTILANYYTKTEVDNLLSALAERVSTNETDIAGIKEEQTTQNTNIEELQNQVETLQEDLESANAEIEELNTDISNMRKASYKVDGQGTDITLENTSENKFVEFGLEGRTEQEQLTGKNLLPFPYNSAHQSINKDGQIVLNGNYAGNFSLILTNTLLLPAGTYILSFGDNNNDLPNGTYALLRDVENDVFIDNYIKKYNKTFTLENSTKIGVTIVIIRGTYNNEILEPMIRLSSITDGTWEKYCGGIPSPNPDYPQQIKNVTGNANVKIQNKNLFDKNSLNIIQNRYLTITGGTGNNENFAISDYILVNGNTQYSLQPYRNLGSAICFYDENKNFISGIQLSQANPSLTTPIDCKYLRISFQKADKDIEQLEQGTTATSYVPHHEQNLPFTFGSGQRAMQGTELKDDGIHNKRKQVVFDGSEDEHWVRSNSTELFYTSALVDTAKQNGDFLCNYFTKISPTETLQDGQTKYNTTTSTLLQFKKLDITNITDWREWLSTHNVIVEYELSEEVQKTEIIPYNATQQSQYNNIKANASSYDDITYITSTSDELSFDMNLVAVADANKVIENQNNEIDTIKSRLDLLEG